MLTPRREECDGDASPKRAFLTKSDTRIMCIDPLISPSLEAIG